MTTNPPLFLREKRDAISSPAFVQSLEDLREQSPILFRTVITPLLEAIEESQDEIIALGREYMELLESLSPKH